MEPTQQARRLILRLARLDAAEGWTQGLNPAQIAALDYLAAANRFSRSPSHLADYLATTRGTVSQTLKSLQRKGLVQERRDPNDKRSIAYDLTDTARALANGNRLAEALGALRADDCHALTATLQDLLISAVAQNQGRPFGICYTCRHFQKENGTARCALLRLDLRPEETQQICHEHAVV